MFNVLAGVRIVDLGRFVAAPSATWLLSNFGAEVIRIEPVGGATDREIYPLDEQADGAVYAQFQSNKRSVCLDCESPEGRKVLAQLLETVDAVVLSAPEATLARQGLDYETLAAINPRIIYLNVSTFTSVGPRARQPGFDGVGQAMSGAAYLSGFGDTPTRSVCSFVDVSTGIHSALAIVCALLERERSGKGHKIETALMMSAYAAMSWLLVEQENTGRDRIRTGNRAQSAGPSDFFRTADGWIVVQVLGDAMFERIARVVGKPEWLDDPRFKTDEGRGEYGAALSEGVAEWCAGRTSQVALDTFYQARVPAAPVLSPRQALRDPQVAALGMVQSMQHPELEQPLRLLKAPIMVDGRLAELRSRPPLLGEHTEAVLRDIGLSQNQLDELCSAGVIAGPGRS